MKTSQVFRMALKRLEAAMADGWKYDIYRFIDVSRRTCCLAGSLIIDHIEDSIAHTGLTEYSDQCHEISKVMLMKPAIYTFDKPEILRRIAIMEAAGR